MSRVNDIIAGLDALPAMSDDTYAWPHGSDILVWRALAARGLARETSGICEGCRSHRRGTLVPVFELLAERGPDGRLAVRS